MALLSIEGVTKTFGGLSAVDNVTFQVHEGQIVGLIGPNGAGKTTCFNLISGFIKPTTGQISFCGNSITPLAPHKIASLGMVRTFQHTSVFTELTVFENIMSGKHLQASKHLWASLFNRRKYAKVEAQLKEKALEVLELMDLQGKAETIAKNLPYGEQRKLEIAIALAAEPTLLLLDEPAAGMNETESASLVEIIRKLKKSGMTVLIVEHDMKVVMNLCDDIVVLDQGRKIAAGSPAEIRANPDVIKVYLGGTGEETPSDRHPE